MIRADLDVGRPAEVSVEERRIDVGRCGTGSLRRALQGVRDGFIGRIGSRVSCDVAQDRLISRPQRLLVAPGHASPILVVRREAVERRPREPRAGRSRERHERVARGAVDPRRAEIERRSERIRCPGTSTDPVARLEDGDGLPGLGQSTRRSETGRAGADDERRARDRILSPWRRASREGERTRAQDRCAEERSSVQGEVRSGRQARLGGSDGTTAVRARAIQAPPAMAHASGVGTSMAAPATSTISPIG